MADWVAEQQAAAESLAEDGQLMTLTRVTPGAFDAVAGSSTGDVTQTWPRWGILTTYNSMDRLAAANRDGSLIQTGDMKAIVEATGGVVPQPGDQLTASAATWKVIAVDPVAPAGVPVIFKVQVRK